MRATAHERAGVGPRIRQERTRKGWSQEQLAERLGLTKGQVSRYESNDSRVTTGRLQQIANALGVPVRRLLP